PPCGGGSRWGREVAAQQCSIARPPPPTPPHKGEGRNSRLGHRGRLRAKILATKEFENGGRPAAKCGGPGGPGYRPSRSCTTFPSTTVSTEWSLRIDSSGTRTGLK